MDHHQITRGTAIEETSAWLRKVGVRGLFAPGLASVGAAAGWIVESPDGCVFLALPGDTLSVDEHGCVIRQS